MGRALGDRHTDTSKSRIRATFFGTSSIHVTDGTSSILTDGFFSRPSLVRVRFGRCKPDHERISEALDRGRIARLDALFVAHSHLDHVMDSPEVARRTGATMYGSESTGRSDRPVGSLS